MRKNVYGKRIRILSVLLGILIFLACTATALLACSIACERSARFVPDYPKTDLTQLAQAEDWTDENYDALFRQTGLGRPALDELKTYENFAEKLKEFQDEFFYRGKIEHDMAAVTTPHDRFADGHAAPAATLKKGDIILSSACHTFGWRNGHAAIVLNPRLETTIESFTPSEPSGIGSLKWFLNSSNFMVLRLKAEYRRDVDPEKVADAAAENLIGIPYDLTVGVLSPKDQCKNGRTAKKTQCAHIVWQAFYNFGLDIDSNGGAVVVPRDIARSKYFEVVQMSGFDPDKLW